MYITTKVHCISILELGKPCREFLPRCLDSTSIPWRYTTETYFPYCHFAGYRRTFLATVATLLLANAVFAQNPPPVTAPVITNVKPGDASANIGFIASRVAPGTPPVREYVVSCSSPGNSGAGVIESKFYILQFPLFSAPAPNPTIFPSFQAHMCNHTSLIISFVFYVQLLLTLRISLATTSLSKVSTTVSATSVP